MRKSASFLTVFLVSILTFIQLGAQSAEGYIAFGDNYFKQADMRRAAIQYTRALELKPNHVEALVKRSRVYAIMGEFDQSSADLQAANALNPYAKVYLNSDYRGDVLAKKSFTYEAKPDVAFEKSFVIEDEYQKLIPEESEMTYIDTLIEYAIIAISNEAYDESQSYLNEIKSMGFQSALVYDLQGVLFMKNEAYVDAVDQFTQAIKQDPRFVLAYHNRAVAHSKLQNYKQAKSDFLKAIDINGSIANIHFGKAKLMEDLGDHKDAQVFYKKAMNVSKEYAEARSNYSAILKTMGEYTEAMNEINNSIKQEPDIGEHYFIRGGIHFIYGEYDAAIRDYNTFLQYYPDHPDGLFNRGLAYIFNEDKDRGCLDLHDSIDNGYLGANSDIVLFMCE